MIRGAFIFLLTFCCATVYAKTPTPIPDFTAGDKLDKKAPHDWNLGPIGARGWVYGWKGETTASRQILITEVTPDSPGGWSVKERRCDFGFEQSKVQ